MASRPLNRLAQLRAPQPDRDAPYPLQPRQVAMPYADQRVQAGAQQGSAQQVNWDPIHRAARPVAPTPVPQAATQAPPPPSAAAPAPAAPPPGYTWQVIPGQGGQWVPTAQPAVPNLTPGANWAPIVQNPDGSWTAAPGFGPPSNPQYGFYDQQGNATGQAWQGQPWNPPTEQDAVAYDLGMQQGLPQQGYVWDGTQWAPPQAPGGTQTPQPQAMSTAAPLQGTVLPNSTPPGPMRQEGAPQQVSFATTYKTGAGSQEAPPGRPPFDLFPGGRGNGQADPGRAAPPGWTPWDRFDPMGNQPGGNQGGNQGGGGGNQPGGGNGGGGNGGAGNGGGNNGGSAGGGDQGGLPISSEFEAARQAAADQLAAELSGLQYEESQIGPMVNLMLSRLQEDENEDMRMIDEEMNARGIYNSGVRTYGRRTRGEAYGRQRSDVALDTARREQDIGLRRQKAHANYQRMIAEALMAIAQLQARNPNTPGGTDDGDTGGGNGNGNGGGGGGKNDGGKDGGNAAPPWGPGGWSGWSGMPGTGKGGGNKTGGNKGSGNKKGGRR